MRTLILVVIFLSPLWCRAETQLSLIPIAKKAFEQYAPGRVFYYKEVSFGDINNDGVTDFVTFISEPNINDGGVENLKITVFLGSRNNTFTFYEASGDTFNHGNVSQDLEIEKQSIYLRRSGSGGCCSRWEEKFQFKIRQDQLMLVGLELSSSANGEDAKPKDDYGTSANLFTQKVIKWSGYGKGRTEKIINVSTLKPVALKDFNYGTFIEKYSGALW